MKNHDKSDKKINTIQTRTECVCVFLLFLRCFFLCRDTRTLYQIGQVGSMKSALFASSWADSSCCSCFSFFFLFLFFFFFLLLLVLVIVFVLVLVFVLLLVCHCCCYFAPSCRLVFRQSKPPCPKHVRYLK